MSKFSLKRPRRLASFICLLMGLLIIVSMFLPIFKLDVDILGNKVTTGTTGYDMVKAVINKDHLLKSGIETQIYKIVNKLDKDTTLSTSGVSHNALFKALKADSTTKLYAYFIYFGAIIALICGVLMVVFGLLGTLIRAKFFKACNILFSLFALIGSALAVVGTFLIAKPLGALFIGMTVPFSYWAIVMVVPALIAIIGYVLIRNKR